MMDVKYIVLGVLIILFCELQECSLKCLIDPVMRNTWFSFERGQNTETHFEKTYSSNHGECVDKYEYRKDNQTLLFKDSNGCYHCVQIYIRTGNILEKTESGCVTFRSGYVPSLEEACLRLNPSQALITMFNENYIPSNCRSALEGVWHFAYQNRFSFTGECNHPDAFIRSCQEPGSQFLIANQKFTIDYKKCEGISESFEAKVEFTCLGDWFIGKNHFIAAANTKESRKDEKFRCFIRNRDDDLYIGSTITPECAVLKSPENSPARFRVTPVKNNTIAPGCLLPQNFSGEWINTAHTEADVFINQTHIIETQYPDEGRYRRTVYVCREARENRYMMARLNIDGCQTDFVCFEFVPRHHNVIRYRKGLEMIIPDYSTVCSYIQFKSGVEWNYDLFLARNPVPVMCPVAGKFNFTQRADDKSLLLQTRILKGYTEEPWDNIFCRENISDFSVCGEDQKEMWIDVNYCISVDAYGRHVDIYTRTPFPIRCPITGKFSFTQVGEIPLETRILGGLTSEPRPLIECRENISEFSVCDEEGKDIWVDAERCISVDHFGRDVDIYSDPDYKLKCVGYWKENLKSYLITFDDIDPYSKYRCWVYERADLNKVLMSQGVGPSCNLHQSVHDRNSHNGTAVSLSMVEYEREHDRCPMHFDDGSNPWKGITENIITFRFASCGSMVCSAFASFLCVSLAYLLY